MERTLLFVITARLKCYSLDSWVKPIKNWSTGNAVFPLLHNHLSKTDVVLFQNVLSQQYDKHPIIILKDVKYAELRAMMDYMYRGEVNISQDQLAALLKAAESLQIKGLSDNKPSRPPSRPAPAPPAAHPPRAPSPPPQVSWLFPTKNQKLCMKRILDACWNTSLTCNNPPKVHFDDLRSRLAVVGLVGC